jgi:hypothetical protein
MTSSRQIEANRRNALKSTGSKTEAGKQTSRCNAVRHGLTAETVIGALEDAEEYKAFEAAITADYDAQSGSNASSSYDWPVSCGVCGVPPQLKPDCSKFKPII